MCLSSVTRKFRPTAEICDGWKVFQVVKVRGELRLLAEFRWNRPYPIGRWVKAKRVKLKADDHVGYTSGFHAFASELGANFWSRSDADLVVKVKLRRVRVEGTQNDSSAVIADEMMIPKVSKRAMAKAYRMED